MRRLEVITAAVHATEPLLAPGRDRVIALAVDAALAIWEMEQEVAVARHDRPRNEALAGRLAAKVRQSPPPGTKEHVP